VFRSSRRSRRREGQRPALIVLAGVLTIVVLGTFIWLAEHAYSGLPFLSYRTVYVNLPNIGHLQEHDPVDIAGVRVGQVLSTSTLKNRALVKLQLQGVGPLPVNTKAVVRANGLLGARYMELDPGSSTQTLPNNGTITETNPTSTYTWGVPEALNLFDSKTRAALGYMLNGLGQGVEGRGMQLNQAIHVGPTSGANFDPAAYAILGRPGAAASFIPQVNSGVTALNSASDNLANSFHPGAVSAQTIVTESTPIHQLLSFAPSWEPDVVRFGPYGSQLLDSVVTLTKAADQVLPIVPRALGSATNLLNQAAAPLRNTKQVFDEVPTAVPAALSILGSVKPNLTPLKGLFTSLNGPNGPVQQLSLHGCDIQSFATGARSMVSWGTLPGTPYGPNEGFPFTAIVGPGSSTNFINSGFTFPIHTVYHPPCYYVPGQTLNTATVLQVLSSLFGGA
jgi:phospholipid/cholesterol/gamma-HCH transport system substrate-binding protein